MSPLAPGPEPRFPPPALLTPQPSFIYRLVSYLLVFPLYRLLFRGRTASNGQVPMEGALVVVANHGSHLDPPLVGHALGRPVAFMAKAELFRVPLLGPIIRACGAYPVSRGASDREAIRVAMARLAEGWATGVFLDGTRQGNGRVNDPQHGAAFLAAKAGIPLLPVAIVNSHRALGTGRLWPRLVPIHIRIGQPVPPPASRRRADLEATTLACQEQINGLLDQGLLPPAKLRSALPPTDQDHDR
ncbi:1-acyl-sn-glycerol-3-phosphate acyltransferase [Synechococcus sp. Tobar12-5m-g]|uniref:lysophospholipid acyltransferase family protein n=1 Tax=unclassified Synechococcus TaxID=2626047 RepID=UPI0020CFC97E|nr:MULTISPECIES: lysophospholipid acyltransferase family protein [unclassified Synechococcus]MCP9772533.1 1-acyl-sn-glycerol-3-phosphate acyltransferase [Synechococcus sp. Tobar12-5m-g]MCP9873372.1 1-acyl-sn-glycerol-3-phosphate acyltransferase [Synechococcus sp. Cruz CV-v-12]